MSRRRSRAPIEIFGFSFLDVICCGFGAILLLLVISRTGGAPEEPTETAGAVRELKQAYFALNSERDTKLQQQEALAKALDASVRQVTEKQAELTAIQRSTDTARDTLSMLNTASDKIAAARMTLDTRLKRISPTTREEVGGIPVDSDYVIFVIDTSGSMQQIWSRVRAEVASILNIHPKVKGIQVMNDMGQYMFAERGKRWLPDGEASRRMIQSQLGSWSPYSNSSPVEGLRRAINDFYDPSRTISIYVLGDEFSGPYTEPVLESIRRINSKDAKGGKKVRIHGIGFRTIDGPTVRNFAKLMRQVALENEGTFLAIN